MSPLTMSEAAEALRVSKRWQLTLAQAAEWLRYEPETGHLYWIKSRSWRTPVGSRAEGGSGRYTTVYVCGHSFGAHRLAFLFAFGRWPSSHIDHINGDGRDNRPGNLREATWAENNRNRKVSPRNKAGFKGVRFRKSRGSKGGGRWVAHIYVDGKHKWLGSFESPEQAHAAYAEAAKKAFGEFARAG